MEAVRGHSRLASVPMGYILLGDLMGRSYIRDHRSLTKYMHNDIVVFILAFTLYELDINHRNPKKQHNNLVPIKPPPPIPIPITLPPLPLLTAPIPPIIRTADKLTKTSATSTIATTLIKITTIT